MTIEFTLLNKTTCLLGKRGSGKSVMAKQLIQDEKHIFGNRIYLFSPTEKLNHDYAELIAETHIFDQFSDKWCKALMDKLSGIQKQDLKPILLVFDDCGSEKDWNTSREFIKLFTRGRHINLSILCCNQYAYQLPKICRSNCDWVLASQQPAQSLDILETEFNTGLKPEEFRKLYKVATVDYGFFLINNTTTKDGSNASCYGRMKADI